MRLCTEILTRIGMIQDDWKRIFYFKEHPELKLYEVLNIDKTGTGEYIIIKVIDNRVDPFEDGKNILKIRTISDFRIFYAGLFKNKMPDYIYEKLGTNKTGL